MPKILSENSYTILATHQMLNDLGTAGAHLPYAVAPTQFDEQYLGYDARVMSVKLLMVQYKRPHKVAAGLRYYLNLLQVATLQVTGLAADHPSAYFCFPTLLFEKDLASAIQQGHFMDAMRFVPVENLLDAFKRILIRNDGRIYSDDPHDRREIQDEPWAKILDKIVRCSRGMIYLVRRDDVLVRTLEGRRFDSLQAGLREVSDLYEQMLGTNQPRREADELLDQLGRSYRSHHADRITASQLDRILEIWRPRIIEGFGAKLRIRFEHHQIRRSQFMRVPLKDVPRRG